MKRGPKGVIEFLSFDTQFCDCIPEFKKFRAQMAARLKDSKPGEKKKDGK